MSGVPRKVWVQVEVVDKSYGYEGPHLLNGVDIEKTRATFADLMTFRPGYGPAELFNSNNPMYTAPKSLAYVIEHAYGRNPLELREEIRQKAYNVVEDQQYDPKTLQVWANRRFDGTFSFVEARAAYIQRRKERIDHTLDAALDDAPPAIGLSWFAYELGTTE